MPKAKPKPNNAKQLQLLKRVLLGAGVIVVMLLVGQFTIDVMAFNRWRSDGTQIRTLIVDAIRNVHDSAPIDAPTGKVYLPEARLVLPAPDPFYKGIEYSVWRTEDDKGIEEVSVTTQKAENYGVNLLNKETDINKVFTQVTEAQACSRGVHLTFKPNDDTGQGLSKAGSKLLADGRTLYAVKEDNCRHDLGGLALYLLQAQSY